MNFEKLEGITPVKSGCQEQFAMQLNYGKLKTQNRQDMAVTPYLAGYSLYSAL